MTIDDRMAISELLARYSHTFDSGDADGWADCFTKDGTFEGRKGKTEGRQALKDYALAAIPRGTYRHFVGNVVIDPDDSDVSAARVKSYMIYYEVTAEGIVFKTTAIQRDRVVKQAGQWKIRERVITVDAATTSSAVRA
jgi:3-phenylpropionate/cinnamic acid dioxygenase small subunit